MTPSEATTGKHKKGDRRLRVVQGLTVAVFLAVAVLGVRLVMQATAHHDKAAKPAGGEVDVAEAVNLGTVKPVAVRGWVFNDGSFGLRLCNGLRPGSPPRCLGPFINVTGVDESAFVLKRARDAKGQLVVWQPTSVALYGRVNGTQMQVDTVLG